MTVICETHDSWFTYNVLYPLQVLGQASVPVCVCVCVCVCVVVCDGPAREETNLSYFARDPLFWLDIMYELVNVNLNFLFFSSGTPGLHFSLQVS